MSQRTSAAVHSAFNRYIAHMCRRVIDVYGTSYMTYENTKNNWRYQLPYSATLEEFLILESKVFLRMQDKQDGKFSDPAFLKVLVNQMADYLSAYTARSCNANRNQSVKQLKKRLWDENTYIQHMLAGQAQRRMDNTPRTPETIAKKRREQKRKQALRDLETARQVRAEFVSAGYRYVKR